MASNEKNQPEKHGGDTTNEFARRFKSNPFVFIGTVLVLIIVVIAFVLVPAIVPSGESGGADLTFGYYNKAPISYVPDNYFYNWQQVFASYYQPSINESNSQLEIYQVLYQIWRQAFNEAAVHAGKLDEMKSAGYLVPAARVDREVARLPQYQENGRFSTARYRQESNNKRMNTWRMTRETIAANRYSMDMSSIGPSSAEKSFIRSLASPQRRFDMASFPIDSYPDSEVALFAESNSRLFRVTHLSRITVNSSENEAEKLLASIKDGTSTFEDTAKASSQDAESEKGGDMGSRMAYELNYIIQDESLREAVINLSSGSFSEVIPLGENSWAFFRAEEDPRPAGTGDTATMEKIRSYVISTERGRIEDWLIQEAEKFIAAAKEKGFDSALMDLAKEKKSFGPLPLNYGDTDLFPSVASSGIDEIGTAGSNAEFWKAAFMGPLMTPSSPVVLGNNVVVLYPVEETSQEDGALDYLDAYFESVVSSYAETSSRSYFLTNGKLDVRFDDVFGKYFNPF